MPESDGRVEFEVRADLSKIDADMPEKRFPKRLKKVQKNRKKSLKRRRKTFRRL